MKTNKDHSQVYHLGVTGAIMVLIGTIFPSLFAVFLQPKQPPWVNAEVFVENYHIIQSLPFYFGYFLIGGSIILLAAIYLSAKAKAFPFLGVLFGIVGASVVCLNYIIQTTFVPVIVASFSPAHAPLLQAMTMGNPTSFAWASEMWGYGFLGIATWFAADYFNNRGIEKTTKILFIINGILSVGGAFYTAVDPGWVLTPAGYIGFGIWNILYFALAAITIRVFLLRKKKDIERRSQKVPS